MFIDPSRAVDRAIITHAHSDHARPGSKYYLCHKLTAPILRLRLGKNLSIQEVEYGETFSINGVTFSLHPAGHVIGSAQIRLEYNNEIWVVSGDYKTQDDGISMPFAPITCHHFITESTFGLPIYNFASPEIIRKEIVDWVAENDSNNYSSVFLGYSLGKAQRIAIDLYRNAEHTIYMHPSIAGTHQAFYESGIIDFPATTFDNQTHVKTPSIFLLPPSANFKSFLPAQVDYKVAICSGWMQLNARRKMFGVEKGFAMSDHADWQQLITATLATKAENVYVTHGYSSVFARYLREEKGINAMELEILKT